MRMRSSLYKLPINRRPDFVAEEARMGPQEGAPEGGEARVNRLRQSVVVVLPPPYFYHFSIEPK
jgi:hypothetical protein